MLDYISLLPVAVLTVLWYLLRQKDAKQEEDITILFKLHRANEQAITNLRLLIASEHYPKRELDTKFDKLETAIVSGLDKLNTNLGAKFDKLADALTEHVTLENNRSREQ